MKITEIEDVLKKKIKMKDIKEVVEYLEQRKLDLIELENESKGHMASTYTGGLIELNQTLEFINEEN